MDTVEKLIDDLGQWFDICGQWHEMHISRGNQFVEVKDEKDKPYLSLYKNGKYKIHVAIMDMPFVYVRNIIEYAVNTDERDWFTEEKENEDD